MSLVGSLEDLGLGDILQIVSLSRKSGQLQLRSDSGEGRIVLRDGRVCGAFVKGGAEDLRGLLVGDGFLSPERFEEAEARTRRGGTLPEALAEVAGLSPERLDSLRREHVERVVVDMFGWRSGEFSFEIRDHFDDVDGDLLHPSGINAQYLAMEGTRLGDERGQAPDDDAPAGAAGGFEIGDDEGMDDALDAALGAVQDAAPPAAEAPEPDTHSDTQSDTEPDTEPETQSESETQTQTEPEWDSPTGENGAPEDEPERDATNLVAEAAARRADAEPEERVEPQADVEPGADAAPADVAAAPEATAPQPEPPAATPPPAPALVVIDPDLAALEWLKAELKADHPRIHIFQRSEGGVARIRQYLRRGELPLVLVAAHASGDPLTGSEDLVDLVRRLRVQAPRMSLVVLRPEGLEGGDVPGADAWVPRPASADLQDAAGWSRFASAADRIRDALRVVSERIPKPGSAAGAGEDPEPRAEAPTSLRRLRAVSRRLRDPETRGEVLSLVLQFAAEHFSRVAIFLVRDDRAVGVAQRGLDRAGGPGDEAFRKIELGADDPPWFRKVTRSREAVTAPPDGAGDRWLGALLGDALADAAYVAPIESCDEVVALLYGDNLPDRRPIGDTSALEVVLHEAGLALDRALLERALGE